MTSLIYTLPPRRATETPSPFRLNRHRHQVNFARAAMFEAFGVQHGKAIHQAKFIDHVPGARMCLAPGSWFQR